MMNLQLTNCFLDYFFSSKCVGGVLTTVSCLNSLSEKALLSKQLTKISFKVKRNAWGKGDF